MTPIERERFDQLLDRVVGSLPPGVRRLLDEVPVIVLDRPTRRMIDELSAEHGEDLSEDVLAGLHSGLSLTERSVEHSGTLPEEIHLFREGIVELADGWDGDDADERVAEEIRVTLLHEIGHHFGLDENDLDRLGYA
ncbi:MAG: metallopeptidase family protein [Phycisphaeraceae bacterium]|nr:metallopeptidase family protein [Phycisphaerae bacterium]MBX3393710.1 metallopeptidase family protein [Phycisphaeraceae bacterium]HRJ49557.1 metallopeptidase family protein [Phycisphaerales bacterium]